MILTLLVGACSDHTLTPQPGAVDSADTAQVADTGDDSAETGEPLDTGPDCGPREGLYGNDGASLELSADLNNSVGWGSALAPGRDGGASGGVWVVNNGCATTDQYLTGAYLLQAQDWSGDSLVPGERADLWCDYSDWPVRGIFTLGGLTAESAFPNQGAWFWGETFDEHEQRWWLVNHPSAAPLDLEHASSILSLPRNFQGGHAADFDGDGLDDLVAYTNAGPLFFRAPFAEQLGAEDADFAPLIPETEEAGWAMSGIASADMDADGYTDMEWISGARTWNDGVQATDLAYVRGPILERSDWSRVDGVMLDDAATKWSHNGSFSTEGQDRGIRSAGDVNGDGREDVTVYSENDEYGDAGSSLLYVVDHAPEGTEELNDLPIRLVGPSTWLGSAGGGDFNGDGFGDLLAAQQFADLPTGTAFQSYVLLGPLDGPMSLVNDALVLRLSASDYHDSQQVLAVPDITGDGADDIVLSTKQDNLPGTVWLFPGCRAW